jgi:hypothetical protein
VISQHRIGHEQPHEHHHGQDESQRRTSSGISLITLGPSERCNEDRRRHEDRRCQRTGPSAPERDGGREYDPGPSRYEDEHYRRSGQGPLRCSRLAVVHVRIVRRGRMRARTTRCSRAREPKTLHDARRGAPPAPSRRAGAISRELSTDSGRIQRPLDRPLKRPR